MSAPARGAPRRADGDVVRPAPRRPLQLSAVLALVAACGIGTARSSEEGVLLAGLSTLAALALVVPALLWNRNTLPFALVMGALPAVFALRAHPFPSYEVPLCGVLLVACGELAARAWYVHSLAPRGRAGAWSGTTIVLLGAGTLAAAGVMAAARANLDGAVVLTAIGAAALVAAGSIALRIARR